MSLTDDLRAYADSAVHQGRQTFSAAQAQFRGVTEQAGEIVNRFAAPVLDGARRNASGVIGRAEELVGTLKRDPRVGKLFGGPSDGSPRGE